MLCLEGQKDRCTSQLSHPGQIVHAFELLLVIMILGIVQLMIINMDNYISDIHLSYATSDLRQIHHANHAEVLAIIIY